MTSARNALRSLITTLSVFTAATACADGLAPLPLAQAYDLQLVNGEPLPIITQFDDSLSPFIDHRIESGSISFPSRSVATRTERVASTVVLSGDTIYNFAEFTEGGPFRRVGSLLIIHYPLRPVTGGPPWPEDTLQVSSAGLTEERFVGPGTVTRLYVPVQ